MSGYESLGHEVPRVEIAPEILEIKGNIWFESGLVIY